MTGTGPMRDVSPEAAIPVWEELVVAVLAVYQFPVERVLSLRERLHSAGLLDIRAIADAGEAKVTRELNAAGYKRGLLTGLYAERLVKLATSVLANDESAIARILSEAEDSEVERVLRSLPGIGPKVVGNFLALRERRRLTRNHKGD
jgi:3-methyladenine DNA glycosylase/8-oxoguanine DNA glycosylase